MKRIAALLLLSALLLSSCASTIVPETTETAERKTESAVTETETKTDQYAEGHMTAIPDYTLPDGASTQTVRETAVRAMRDQLGVRWTPYANLKYNKEGAISEKDFYFNAGVLYAGLPYTEAGGSLVQFLQYYDFDTGVVTLDPKHVNDLVGNVCGGAVMWGWAAVSHTLRGYFQSGSMTYAQNVIPVGRWTYPDGISTFHEYPTWKIVDDNGEQVMMESYALVQMADGLTSSGEGSLGSHTMMAVENAKVVRTGGKIDPEKSTIVIQDQRGGGESDGYPVEEGEMTVRYSGRTRFEVSFRWLFDNDFVPVTLREFTGEEPYRAPRASFSGDGDSVEGILAGTVDCNLALCTVKMRVTDEDGKDVGEKFINTTIRDTESGEAYAFPLSRFGLRQGGELWISPSLKQGKSYHLTVSAIPASGRELVALETDFTL